MLLMLTRWSVWTLFRTFFDLRFFLIFRLQLFNFRNFKFLFFIFIFNDHSMQWVIQYMLTRWSVWTLFRTFFEKGLCVRIDKFDSYLRFVFQCFEKCFLGTSVWIVLEKVFEKVLKNSLILFFLFWWESDSVQNFGSCPRRIGFCLASCPYWYYINIIGKRFWKY